MGAIGRLSYSLYLWHWPVLTLAPALLGHALGLPSRLLAVLLAVGLAVLTLRFIENPLRFAPRIRNSPKASLALGGLAAAVAVCVAVVAPKLVPDPVGHGPAVAPMSITSVPVPPGSSMAAYDAAVRDVFAQVQAAVAASAERKALPSNLNPPPTDGAARQDEVRAILNNGCLRVPFQRDHPQCVSGDPTSKTTVALIGDSRAGMLSPAFNQIAAQQHWRLVTLTKAACPIVDLPFANRYVNGLAEKIQGCEQWRAETMERLRAERPQLIVIESSRLYGADGTGAWLPGFTAFNAAWIDSLTPLVQQLRGTGAQVLMLGPIPDPMTSVPTCLATHLDDATECSTPREALTPSGIAAEATAAAAGGGQYADVAELFCTAERCPFVVGNTLAYFDTHLTHEYAEQLAPAMGALADRALANG